ncbi:MAG TPA: molybdate ABC transporter substrate-binding protein [Actinomycetota bacterium]|nr:molybdate ABC transporter substrate-binding protein [Actinomycetota bacterium]
MKRLFALLLATTLVMAACSSDDDGGDTSSSATEPAETTELTVFAASSLTTVFQDAIGPAFEHANPGVTVSFNVGASDALAAQIQSEGTADVFASASGTWMDEVEKDPGVSDRTDFVMNRLVIITPPDNPADIQSIDDLATPGVQLVLAAEGVPVGDYAREALDSAGILDEALANVVSNEEDNASVVAKITTGGGEADAAIVYTSDVSDAAGNDVNAVAIPEDVNVIATYPIAVVEEAPNADVAADFVAYVVGSEGQATLKDYGFEPLA